MEWINIEVKKLPDPQKYIYGFSLPAISHLYGYGFIVRGFIEEWIFTNDHKNFYNTSSVIYWMPLPSPPKE